MLLGGEPGIGKSRLTAALMESLANEPHTQLRYFCSPQHTDSALYPITSQIERAAGFAHDDTAEAKLDKLDALLAPTFTSGEDAALLADMLSLPNDGRYKPLDLPPQQRRQKTLAALTAQLEALAGAKPVLMIFEDVHWGDPTSLEVLGRMLDRTKKARGFADHYIPAGVRPTLDWQTRCHGAQSQSARGPRNRCHYRRSYRQYALPENIRQTLPSGRTAFPCLLKK